MLWSCSAVSFRRSSRRQSLRPRCCRDAGDMDVLPMDSSSSIPMLPPMLLASGVALLRRCRSARCSARSRAACASSAKQCRNVSPWLWPQKEKLRTFKQMRAKVGIAASLTVHWSNATSMTRQPGARKAGSSWGRASQRPFTALKYGRVPERSNRNSTPPSMLPADKRARPRVRLLASSDNPFPEISSSSSFRAIELARKAPTSLQDASGSWFFAKLRDRRGKQLSSALML
mmetsp:Transcript_126425/g.236321  ORF Transcript_126425/g.236321 Transcript_126425/m.236321 type:complete len:231 (-) Transcript_126425:83-775(-)